ncbi:hypothetical protein V496_07427 [Pseudogymnoascus sp. VKM F-4515 (FW-2607)]|nr:hypothetical protein V496_07427 [Pseudogymnoascus sp. VKM F-4515 (FW-2607)]
MARTSDLPEPNKAVSILVNHQLRCENRALHDKQVDIEDANKKLAEEMQVLREGVEETLPARLQQLEGGVKAVDERCTAKIQTLGDEVKTTQHTHTQAVARVLKESDEKRGVEIQLLRDQVNTTQQTHAEELTRILKEADKKRGGQNQLLRDGMEAVRMRYDELLERVKALEARLETQPGVATNRPRKKQRTAKPTSQKPTHSTANEAKPATKTPLPIAQADQGTPKSNRVPQTAASAPPVPDMDSTVTIIASTPIIPVPDPNICRFDNGHIHQGGLGLQEYVAACSQHVASIRATDQNVDEPGKAEKDAMVKFVFGMRENRERKRLAEDMEKAGWAVIDRGGEGAGVKFLCGWAVMEEVLRGWEKGKTGDAGGRSK